MFPKNKRIENKQTLEDVRALPCSACGAMDQNDAHHVKTKGSGGPDTIWNLISLCRLHHSEAHSVGMVGLASKYPSVRRALRLRNWLVENKHGIWKLTRSEP